MSVLSDEQKQELAFPFHSLTNNELELINRAEKAVLLAVAEKLGHYCKDRGEPNHLLVCLSGEKHKNMARLWHVERYLEHQAAEILFSDGMAGKISTHLKALYLLNDDAKPMDWFWRGVEDNGTLTARKILEVWLEMQGVSDV